MKKIFFILLTLGLFGISYGQEEKVSLEVNYPLPIDDNFIGKNYTGIIEIGGKYRFINTDLIHAGASVNGGILKFKNDSAPQNYTATDYMIQSRLFAEFDLDAIPGFHPSVGLGYSFMIFKAEGTNYGYDISDYSKTDGGFNANAGILFDLSDKFFIQMQYDFIKLPADEPVANISFNRNTSLLKFGVGIRI